MSIINKLFRKNDDKKVVERNLINMEKEFGYAFKIIEDDVRKNLILGLEKNEFSASFEDDEELKKFAYFLVFKFSSHAVCSGRYHIYRGVISPTGDGKKLLDIFEKSLKRFEELSGFTQEQLQEERSRVYERIQNMG